MLEGPVVDIMPELTGIVVVPVIEDPVGDVVPVLRESVVLSKLEGPVVDIGSILELEVDISPLDAAELEGELVTLDLSELVLAPFEGLFPADGSLGFGVSLLGVGVEALPGLTGSFPGSFPIGEPPGIIPGLTGALPVDGAPGMRGCPLESPGGVLCQLQSVKRTCLDTYLFWKKQINLHSRSYGDSICNFEPRFQESRGIGHMDCGAANNKGCFFTDVSTDINRCLMYKHNLVDDNVNGTQFSIPIKVLACCQR